MYDDVLYITLFYKIHEIYTNKKVLLLDCDNTLWGGVVAEDGLEKIQIN